MGARGLGASLEEATAGEVKTGSSDSRYGKGDVSTGNSPGKGPEVRRALPGAPRGRAGAGRAP